MKRTTGRQSQFGVAFNLINMIQNTLERYSIECRKYFRVWFGFALLRSVNKTRTTLINWNPNQNQSCFGRTRFPALGTSYIYLLPILIGSLFCLHLLRLARVITLVLVLRHSIETAIITDNISDLKYFYTYIRKRWTWNWTTRWNELAARIIYTVYFKLKYLEVKTEVTWYKY